MRMNDDAMRAILDQSDSLARESGLRVAPGEGKHALDQLDGIAEHEYLAEMQQHQVQFTAQFLIDRAGIIRWSNVECRGGLDESFEKFPADDELLSVARRTAV